MNKDHMNHGHVMDKYMLDLNKFFRIRDNRLEVFLTGICNGFLPYFKKHNPNTFITNKTRLHWICDKIKEGLGNPLVNFVVLDCRMENYSVSTTAKHIINALNLQPNQVLVLTSTDSKGVLEGYDCIVDLTANIDWGYNFSHVIERCISWENIEIDIPVISLAGRPTESRAKFMKDLVELLKDKARLSFGSMINFNLSDKERKMYEKILHPYPFPLLQNTDNKILTYPNELLFFATSQHDVGNNIFQSLVNVVNETNDFDDDVSMLTEKTYKPFSWHQIPIFNATKGHVDKVRSLGFDLFDDIIDHSYDTVTNSHIQKLKILNEVTKFLKKYSTIDDVNNLRKNIFHRLQANNELLHKLYEQRSYEPWPYYG
jgi:hypothetical protein